MDIFNYHPITGEILGPTIADDNPLDPDNPIVPGYATPTPPPTIKQTNGKAPRIALYRDANGNAPQNACDGEWRVVSDYRAVPLYRTADGSPFALSEEFSGLGDLPAFLTDAPPPSPAHVWSAGKWVLSAERAAELFEASKRAAIDGVKTFISEQRVVAAGTSDPTELQARAAKRMIADAVVAGTATDDQTLMLATEARLRGMGETPVDLANKILAKARAMDMVNAAMDGLRRAAENAMTATTDQAALDACVARFRLQIAAVAADAGAIE